MRTSLITKSLAETAVACRCFVRGIGYCNATLVRNHHTGNLILELPWRNYYISSGETRRSGSGVAVSELVSETGLHFYVQSRAGDVWATVNNLQEVSPEIEVVQAIAV